MKFKFLAVIVFFLGLFFSCDKSNTEPSVEQEQRIFGKKGTHEVTKYTSPSYAYTTIYYPSDIAILTEKSPLIFFTSGWFTPTTTSSKYESLLNFIASHGYTVIFTNEGATVDEQYAINAFQNFLTSTDSQIVNDILPFVDTTKIGSIGHSAGGGIAFKILDYYSNIKNYGENGRFIMALDPWFAFGMSEENMKNLPSNTNVVIQKYGAGGNNIADGTDARIPLTEFYLLNSISNLKKDYAIYALENADHNYPTGNREFNLMQGLLKPLDALMEYTFVEQIEAVRVIALENGNDDPYANGSGIQEVLLEYEYPCDGANTIIDYCAIVP